MSDLVRPSDQEARKIARGLLQEARYAALGTIQTEGLPLVTRIAFGLCPLGHPISLISSLSMHAQALKANATASLMVGEPKEKGDPLAHPRLTVQCHARFIARSSAEHAELAEHYLNTHPKAKLYIGFGDFFFVRFDVQSGFLNGGFGRAFSFSPADLEFTAPSARESNAQI